MDNGITRLLGEATLRGGKRPSKRVQEALSRNGSTPLYAIASSSRDINFLAGVVGGITWWVQTSAEDPLDSESSVLVWTRETDAEAWAQLHCCADRVVVPVASDVWHRLVLNPPLLD